MMWASARYHDGVGYQIQMAFDQVSSGPGYPSQGAHAGTVHLARVPGPEIGQERGPGVLAWPQENGVGVASGLLG